MPSRVEPPLPSRAHARRPLRSGLVARALRALDRAQARAPRRIRPWLALLGLLALLVIACGLPYRMSNVSSYTGAAPYWACVTPTPVPTEIIQIGWTTPGPSGTPPPEPIWGYTTPAPTATPFYRIGEFYLNQPAVVGELEITLLSLEPLGSDYTLASFRVVNHSQAQQVVPLSAMVFAVAADGMMHHYNAEGQRLAGLPSPIDREADPIQPGSAFDERLAVRASHTRIGLRTMLFTGSAQPIWFNGQADAVTCRGGSAQWPVPAPRPAGYGYTGGALLPAQPALTGGALPLAEYVRISTPFGCNPWTGLYDAQCPDGAKWNHHGLDLSAVSYTPIYTPIAGEVIFAGWSAVGYGNLVVVRADLGGGDYLFMYFAHMVEAPLVAVGDGVGCWQNIGYVGSTGHSTGPHLHWETRRGADPSNVYATYQVSPDESRVFWGACNTALAPGDRHADARGSQPARAEPASPAGRRAPGLALPAAASTATPAPVVAVLAVQVRTMRSVGIPELRVRAFQEGLPVGECLTDFRGQCLLVMRLVRPVVTEPWIEIEELDFDPGNFTESDKFLVTADMLRGSGVALVADAHGASGLVWDANPGGTPMPQMPALTSEQEATRAASWATVTPGPRGPLRTLTPQVMDLGAAGAAPDPGASAAAGGQGPGLADLLLAALAGLGLGAGGFVYLWLQSGRRGL